MRARGINYDTGFFPGGKASRPAFDPWTAARELEIIANDLRCDAVRVSGGDLARLESASRAAADAGLEVWLSPVPTEMGSAELVPYFRQAAELAADLASRGRVTLVAGCELSVFAKGFLPGENSYDRMAALANPDPALLESMADVPRRFNAVLGEVVAAVRRQFAGTVTYASAAWEPVDWGPFDIVSVDCYRDAANAGTYRDDLHKHFSHGKPVAVTEFGCCAYAGAGDRGAMGWAILDESVHPALVAGEFKRDEGEQTRYLRELYGIFESEGVDAAFWFTFAGYRLPHRSNPKVDLDLASYGVVKLLDAGAGDTYPDMPWEPKEAFGAMATLYAG